MSIYTIKQGKSYSRFFPGFWFNKSVFHWKIKLHTPYDLKGEDQFDWNKAAGISINGFVHSNSVRLGWRYLPDQRGFELCVYTYIKGKRDFTSYVYPYKIRPEVEMYFSIVYNNFHKEWYVRIQGGHYYSMVYTLKELPKPKWGLSYFPYFGGTSKAPNNITVEQTLLK